MKKLNIKSITTTTDENGLVSEIRKVQSYSLKNEDNYVKIYIDTLDILSSLPLGLHPVIFELLKEVEYGNILKINTSTKKKISAKLGKSINTINQYITSLSQKNIIIRIDYGSYYLNPFIFGKGKWKDLVSIREKLTEFNIKNLC